MEGAFLLGIVLIIGVFGLLASYLLARWVLKRSTGTKEMQAISNAIKDGAEAFMRRQFKTIILLAIVVAVILFVGYGFIRAHRPFDPVSTSLGLAFWITLSFAFGALCSLIAGYIGMWVSIRANIRTAAGIKSSINDGLQAALRGGAVSGIMVVAMSLLGVGGLYWLVAATTNIPATKRNLRACELWNIFSVQSSAIVGTNMIIAYATQNHFITAPVLPFIFLSNDRERLLYAFSASWSLGNA